MINLALWGIPLAGPSASTQALGRYAVLKPNYREICWKAKWLTSPIMPALAPPCRKV